MDWATGPGATVSCTSALDYDVTRCEAEMARVHGWLSQAVSCPHSSLGGVLDLGS